MISLLYINYLMLNKLNIRVDSVSNLFEGKPTAHIFSESVSEADCNCKGCINLNKNGLVSLNGSIAERLLDQLITAGSIIMLDFDCSGCAIIEDPVFLLGSRILMEEFCKLIENHPVNISFAIRLSASLVLKFKDIILRLREYGLEHILIDLETGDVREEPHKITKSLAGRRKKGWKRNVKSAVLFLEKMRIKSAATLWVDINEPNTRRSRLFDLVHQLQKHSYGVLRPVNVNIVTNDTTLAGFVSIDCKNDRCNGHENCIYTVYMQNYNELNKQEKELLLKEIDEISYRTKGTNFYPPKIRLETGDVYPREGDDAIHNLQLFTQVGFPTLKSFEDAKLSLSSVYYGGIGTPADRQLSQIIAEMESGNYAILTPTGHAAIAQVMCAFLRSGDHALVVDTAAFSTKSFLCDNYLNSFGVEIEYYSPHITANELRQKIRHNTKVIFLESPGSYTYEIQDLSAVVLLAKQIGITTIFDNTWSASKFLKPLEWGVDVVVTSLGKYHFAISGISMGAIIVRDKTLFHYLQSKSLSVGNRVSQLDCQSATKALDSLDHRLMRQQEVAYKIAESLLQVQEVKTVIFPGLRNFPQYNSWKNLYTGVNSLLTIKLQDVLKEQYSTYLLNYLASLGAIAIGDSYGGSFSLIKKINLKASRKLDNESIEGQYFRIYLGHESYVTLVSQIKKAFQRTSKKYGISHQKFSNLR